MTRQRLTQYSFMGLAALTMAIAMCVVLAPLFDAVKGATTSASSFWPSPEGFRELGTDDELLGALATSLKLAMLVAPVATSLGFGCALCWWNPRHRVVVAVLLLVSVVLPAEVHASSLQIVGTLMGQKSASTFLLYVAHLSWVLPFSTALIMVGLSRVDRRLLVAADDLGAGAIGRLFAVVLRSAWPALLSAFLVAALLSMNEFTRTDYLSGPTTYLTEITYGRMKSGSNPATNALAGAAVACWIIVIASVVLAYRPQAVADLRVQESSKEECRGGTP